MSPSEPPESWSKEGKVIHATRASAAEDTLWSLGCTTLRFLPHGPKGLILIVGVPYSLDFG